MKTLRCAIYTRKSSEEGLEQDFNSLQAQREACEAFIASQKHEGWQLVKTHYDDGGFSGGNIERPAMQKLLEDIEAQKINVVVVYKVDRLTRSLADFAKIVELFDKHGVSFVSVTQQFNTTSSMGRLTLNVLLSFAQFEREVTGERIRDKIAASKKKGMWMGGSVPLGYDVKERKLIINAQEAKIIWHIFQRYLDLGCVRLLQIDLNQNKIRSKSGSIMSRGSLYKLLSNPTYIGKIRHKKECYPGLHDALIDQALWDQVQQHMKDNTIGNKSRPRKSERCPLANKLFDASGERLVVAHANKKGKRYRYYVSQSIANGPTNDSGWRLPGPEIENTVAQCAKRMLADHKSLSSALQKSGVPTQKLPLALNHAQVFCQKLSSDNERAGALVDLIERVELQQDGLKITLKLSPLTGKRSSSSMTQEIPMRMKRRGVELRLVIGNQESRKTDQTLIKTIARAHAWWQELLSMPDTTLTKIAEREKADLGNVSRMMNLAFLAPDIIESIMVGKQPVDLNAQALLRRTELPMSWQEQCRLLGFA